MSDISTERVNDLCDEVGEMEIDALASLCVGELVQVSRRVAAARDAYKGIADAYERSLAEIRTALGMSEHDEHEGVINAIQCMRMEFDSMRNELRSKP